MVEEVIGAYLISCGEVATLQFMIMTRLHIDFVDSENLVNVWYFDYVGATHIYFKYSNCLHD